MINFRKFEEIAYALLPDTHDPKIRCRHFAFLFKKNRIISIGWNKTKTTPLNLKFGYHKLCGIHAEMVSLNKARHGNLKNCSIAVLRIDRNNKLNQSAPCKFCMNVLKHFDIDHIFHTNENGEWIQKQ